MTDLFEKSIQILELPKVLERLAGQAVTQEGKERCLALRPMTDPDDVQRALDETSAAVDMSALRGSPSFLSLIHISGRGAHRGGGRSRRTPPPRGRCPCARSGGPQMCIRDSR